MRYQTYLESDSWKKKRQKFFRKKKRQNQCKLCYAFGPVDVHHLTYARVGSERMSDLRGLCRECHQFVHDCIQVGRSEAPSLKFYNRLAKAWTHQANKKHLWGLRESDPRAYKEKAMAFFLSHPLSHKAVQQRYRMYATLHPTEAA